ncbi:MAG: hypothetical protein RLY86_181 [Pseudomonadota bacterium]|jgi:outer membrane receptor protein involved in Fe transport
MTRAHLCALLLGAAPIALSAGLAAAQPTGTTPAPAASSETGTPAAPAPAPAPGTDTLAMEEIIVTAVAGQTSKLRTSVSVSGIGGDDFANFAPRSTAEIFRNLPGIRSESTGGEGNANIAVRGLPVASGGAKFLQLHEDGLPVLEFGDIAFGNADIFLRADSTVQRIEAVRGGSASTFASNSPGGVINFISRTGEEAGGALKLTRGLDFDTTRGDFRIGGPIDGNWNFHIGGFYREGEGPREAGYNGESGGQVKANLTRSFDNGYARLYVKYLNDRAIGYLPMPVAVSGTNGDPDYDSLPGFDILSDTPHSPYFTRNAGLGGDNGPRVSDIRDGMRPVSTAIGGEFEFDIADDWRIANRFRWAETDGRFVSPFPAEVAAASAIAADIGGAGARLRYANGPQGGQAIANPAGLNGNGLAMRVHVFDTEINDFGNLANDLKLTRSFRMDQAAVDLTVGYYKARQTIDMDWLWNSYLLEVRGDRAALLDVVRADGSLATEGGLIAYGVPFWGNCCTRSYDVTYDIDAPYAALGVEMGDWNIDASLRYDSGDASGSYTGSVQSANLDVNRNGVISAPERSVSVLDLRNPSPVDYDWSYWSWSIGANYTVTPDLAVFARASQGGRANADRLLFGRVRADGSVAEQDAVDMVDQYEAGVKWRSGGFGLFGTLFYAETQEQNFEATSQRFFDRVYEAYGLELEATYGYQGFFISAGATWTEAEIAEDALSPAVAGNTPRRQPDLIYQITPSYSDFGVTIGANIIGSTDAYAQDNNSLILPAYTQVNLFADYALTEGLLLSLNVNNLFNAKGFTEAEEGAIVDGRSNIIRARSINGRTSTLSLSYTF